MSSKPASQTPSLILKEGAIAGALSIELPVKGKHVVGAGLKKRVAKETDDTAVQPEMSSGSLQFTLPLDDAAALPAVQAEGVLSDMSAAFDLAPPASGNAAWEAFPNTGVLMAQAGSDPATVAASGSTTVTRTLSTGIIVAGGLGLALALGGGGGGSGGAPAATGPVADTEAPTIVSMSKSVADKTITLTYSETLDAAHPPIAGAFTVTAGSSALTVTSVEVLGSTVVLHLADLPEGAVSIQYTDPTAGNDTAAIQDAAGNDAADFTNVALADGYIRGAKVYIDTNKNGVVDTTDTLIGTTDANGNFVVPGNAPAGALIAVGGVNIDTGVPNTTALKAPQGSTMVSPLTTLVQAFVEQQVKASPNTVVNAKLISDASSKVAAALGLTLPAGATLTKFDPIATNNTEVQKAAAQVATIVALASNGDAATATTTAATVMANLAKAITTQSTTASAPVINLTSNTVLTDVLPQGLSSTVVAAITAASNTINVAPNIAAISTAQSAALDKIAPSAPTALTAATPSNAPMVKVALDTRSDKGAAAVAGDVVQVFDGSAAVGSPITLRAADIAAGFVNVSLAALADGLHSINAKLTDQAGNAGLLATAVDVTIDTLAPVTPEILDVAGNNIVNAAEKTGGVTLSGKAEAGAKVAVTWGGFSQTVTATSGGTWSALVAADKVPSDSATTSVSVVVTDAAGNNSVAGTRAVVVDTVGPITPTVGTVSTDNAVNAAESTAGVTLSGTTEAGATVVVTWGAVSKNVVAGSGGAWSVNFVKSEVPADGVATTVSVLATDVAGNVSLTGSRAVLVDTTAPATPEINAVAINGLVNLAEKTAGVVLTGKAEAGATVVVGWGSVNKTVTAAGNGTWSATFAAADVPADGNTTVNVVATDVAGNPSSAARLDAGVDTLLPVTPVVNAVGGNDVVNTSEKTAGLSLSGTAEANAQVVLTWGTFSKTVTATSGGTWTVAVAANEVPVDGTASVNAVSTDAAGNASTAGVRNVTVDTTAPASPVVNAVATDNLINATEKAAGLTLSGRAEAASNVVVTWGLASKTVTAASGGTWSATFAANEVPSDGTTSVSVVATDAAGNASTAGTRSVVVDTIAPATPDIQVLAATDAAAGVVVAGKAEANANVTVAWGATSKTVAAAQDGSWTTSFAASAMPSTSKVKVTAVATDAAGNVSSTETAEPVTFASGSYVQATTPGSLDLKLLSSDATKAMFSVSSTGSLTFQDAQFELGTDITKVTYDDLATTLWGGLSAANMDSTGRITFAVSDLNLIANSATTLASFTLNWVNGSVALTLPVADLSLGDNQNLVNPVFQLYAGTGAATGTNGVEDIFVFGPGPVSATGGTGADVFLPGISSGPITLTDFVSGADEIDLHALMFGAGYASLLTTSATAVANAAQFKAGAVKADLDNVAAQSTTLDNMFGAVYEALTSGTNKGVVHLFADADPRVGTVKLVQIDMYLGANSSGGFSPNDLAVL